MGVPPVIIHVFSGLFLKFTIQPLGYLHDYGNELIQVPGVTIVSDDATAERALQVLQRCCTASGRSGGGEWRV